MSCDGNARRVGNVERIDILVVCTGNTCRSPMAAALLQRDLVALGRTDAFVHSAGTLSWGGPPTPHAVGVMDAEGIDLQSHRSVSLSFDLVHDADIVLGMTRSHVSAARAFDPGSVSRSYLLGELVRLGRRAGAREGGALDTWLEAVNRLRPPDEPPGRASDEIHDPVGEPFEMYVRTARQLAALTKELAPLL